jgi:hypothetical protein
VELTLGKWDSVDPLVVTGVAHIVGVVVDSTARLVVLVGGENSHEVAPVVIGQHGRDLVRHLEAVGKVLHDLLVHGPHLWNVANVLTAVDLAENLLLSGRDTLEESLSATRA